MDDQDDLDFINDKLYSLPVPDETIKKIMFYFNVLSNALNFDFPHNFLNYEHPYFKSYGDMEEFLALAYSLNPQFLYQNNVIIYYNKKQFYKYYTLNNDQNGVPYEFKMVNISDSNNHIFNDNYKNNFNILNIDKSTKEFDVVIKNKFDFPHSEDSDISESIEDNYLEEYEYDVDNYKNTFNDSIYESNDKKEHFYSNYKDIQKYYNEQAIKKSSEKIYAYSNQMKSSDELDIYDEYCSEPAEEETKFKIKNIQIIHKLVVTKDWINYIYNEPMKIIATDMKTVIKGKDVIRTKSISLPRNVFFYLELFFLAVFICCSSVLLSWTSTLKKDRQFLLYGGINLTEIEENGSQKRKHFHKEPLNNRIINDSSIVPNKKKYNKINKGCTFGTISATFGIFFFVFVIYMCIRVAREKKKKYQEKKNRKKVGLNLCHILVLILLTLIGFITTFVAEIYIAIALAQNTYTFIKIYVRAQLITNSLILISYVFIIVFYFMI